VLLLLFALKDDLEHSVVDHVDTNSAVRACRRGRKVAAGLRDNWHVQFLLSSAAIPPGFVLKSGPQSQCGRCFDSPRPQQEPH
jgi:hypothetical protein